MLKPNDFFLALISKFLVVGGLLFYTALFCSNSVFAQDEEEEEIPSYLKYVREKYDETFNNDFAKICDAMKTIIENSSCSITTNKVSTTDDNKQRCIIRTPMCVLAQKDSAWQYIKSYTLEPPFIRGGVWTSFRAEWRVIIIEQSPNNINVELRIELSGFEDHASFKAYTFKTNGYYEYLIFEKIKELIN